MPAPGGYLDQLQPLPEGVELDETLAGAFDWVQVFVHNKAELDRAVPQLLAALKPYRPGEARQSWGPTR